MSRYRSVDNAQPGLNQEPEFEDSFLIEAFTVDTSKCSAGVRSTTIVDPNESGKETDCYNINVQQDIQPLAAIGVLAGRWVELYGERLVTIIGSTVFSGALAAAGFCRTLPTLILTQGVLTDVGVGILTVPAITATIPWFPNKRSLALGLASSGAGLGSIFWSFVSRIIISKISYRWALWTMALVSGFLYAVAIILIKLPPGWKRPTFIGRPHSYRECLIMFRNPKFVSLYLENVTSLFGLAIDANTYETQNDQQLEALHSKIRSLRDVTTDIYDDVERQNTTLDESSNIFNSFGTSLAQSSRRAASAFGPSGSLRQYRLMVLIIGSLVGLWVLYHVVQWVWSWF
ncbi:hypothetical protein Clacol_001504 [Clathrus columnatus]|uniref:t-SNARE coiled-coil homology domain-containing protein n=1 Tax=Clathrus columnatus TaxID=1419009 RepID=A0AAV5A3S1_9AGAM|nr:hypothetical protein Clacol_001504 [Clathrus columnatus]